MSLHIEHFSIGPMDNNLYLLRDDESREMVVIDPSIESRSALERAQTLALEGYRMTAIWNTHGHFDHVYDNALWKQAFPVPLFAHEADASFLEHLREQAIWFGFPPPKIVLPDALIETGTPLRVGAHAPRILHLPGHSPGSVAFYFEPDAVCIVGDVLFAGSVGRTDLPGGSAATLAQSVSRLFELADHTRVLPGHGRLTTIAQEKTGNAVARDLLAQHAV